MISVSMPYRRPLTVGPPGPFNPMCPAPVELQQLYINGEDSLVGSCSGPEPEKDTCFEAWQKALVSVSIPDIHSKQLFMKKHLYCTPLTGTDYKVFLFVCLFLLSASQRKRLGIFWDPDFSAWGRRGRYVTGERLWLQIAFIHLTHLLSLL